jgi:hypothetical protein
LPSAVSQPLFYREYFSMHFVRVTLFMGFALLAAGVAGCASGPATRVDSDPSVDLASYRTFGFFQPLATDRGQYSTLMSEHLRQATRAQLERQGYRYSESNPDLRVNFYLNVAERTELRSTPAAGRGFYGYRVGYAGWAGYPTTLETQNYRQGTLSIDIVDTQKRSLVWQGIAEGRVSKNLVDNPGAAVESAVREVFADFPSAAYQ